MMLPPVYEPVSPAVIQDVVTETFVINPDPRMSLPLHHHDYISSCVEVEVHHYLWRQTIDLRRELLIAPKSVEEVCRLKEMLQEAKGRLEMFNSIMYSKVVNEKEDGEI